MPQKKNAQKRERDYATFLGGIKLFALGLQECNANLNRAAYISLLDKNTMQRHISTKYELTEVNKTSFDVDAKFTLVVDSSGKKGEPALLLSCTYAAHFHCPECEITRTYAQRFTDSELRFLVWPFFREFASDVTSKMYIPPILIPFTAAHTEQR